MRPYCLPLLGLLSASCASTKVRPTTNDATFMLVQANGWVNISSTSSAVQTPIVRRQRVGDTLLLTYRRGAFMNRYMAMAHSVVPLDEQTRYVRCANRLFRVVKTSQGFALEPLP